MPLSTQTQLFLARTQTPVQITTGPELCVFVRRIYDSLGLILQRYDTPPDHVVDHIPKLCDTERFTLSCGILRLLQAGVVIESDLSKGLPESIKTSPHHRKEVEALLEYINANRESILSEKLDTLSIYSFQEDVDEGEIIAATIALL